MHRPEIVLQDGNERVKQTFEATPFRALLVIEETRLRVSIREQTQAIHHRPRLRHPRSRVGNVYGHLKAVTAARAAFNMTSPT